MQKVFQGTFAFPLQEKIVIQGFRIETSPHPAYEIKEQRLWLTDHWTLQLVCSPYQNWSSERKPRLLEFPLPWKTSFDWSPDYPNKISVSYLKKPRLRRSSIEDKRFESLLHLDLEAHLTIDLEEPQEAPQEAHHAEPQAGPQVKNAPLNCQIKGCVLDAYLLVPVSKALIEITRPLSDQLIAKVTTDLRGTYRLSGLTAGTYDFNISHPRYPNLKITGYTLKEGQEKSQDFLLRRT